METPNYFLDGLKKKDEKIILEIYNKIFPKVLSFIVYNKGQIIDAEDIFQKALIQIIARLNVKNIEINSTFEAYLFVACKNLWRRELNKKSNKVTSNMPFEHVTEERDMAIAILEQERWEFFQEKFLILSDNCKQILEMFFNKTPYKEIVKKLNYSSEIVVRQRIFKCKNKLINIIKADNRYIQLKEL